MQFQTRHGVVHHLHIPRSGGRYVSNNIVFSGHRCLNTRVFPLRYVSPTGNFQCEYMHFDYNMCIRYIDDFDKMKKFTVVRNHWERFNSAIKHCIPFLTKDGFNLKHLEDYNKFVWYMEEFEFNFEYKTKGFINAFSGWFRPNEDWLGDDVGVWRYENGLGQDFADWLYSHYHIEFNLENNMDPNLDSRGDGEIILSTKMIDNIEYYYKHREIPYATQISKACTAKTA